MLTYPLDLSRIRFESEQLTQSIVEKRLVRRFFSKKRSADPGNLDGTAGNCQKLLNQDRRRLNHASWDIMEPQPTRNSPISQLRQSIQRNIVPRRCPHSRGDRVAVP